MFRALFQRAPRLLSKLNYSCLLCHQPSHTAVCHYCYEDVQFFAAEGIRGNLLRSPLFADNIQHQHYQRLFACGYYHWPFDDLVRLMKFHANSAALHTLGRWFVHHVLPAVTPLPEVLLPVPSALRSFYQRLFNPALALANHIGRSSGLAVAPHWARRQGGATQHFLNKAQRQHNLQKAYVLHECQSWQHVAIVDDVVTTGSTVDTLSSLLWQYSPNTQIDVWAIAVVPPQSVSGAQYFVQPV